MGSARLENGRRIRRRRRGRVGAGAARVYEMCGRRERVRGGVKGRTAPRGAAQRRRRRRVPPAARARHGPCCAARVSRLWAASTRLLVVCVCCAHVCVCVPRLSVYVMCVCAGCVCVVCWRRAARARTGRERHASHVTHARLTRSVSLSHTLSVARTLIDGISNSINKYAAVFGSLSLSAMYSHMIRYKAL